MYLYTLILCIFGVFIITTIVNSNDTNTKKYLRGINQNCIDNAFKQQMNEIITATIATTSQKNIINYSLTICDIHLDPNYNNYEEYSLGKNADYIIINKLQDLLVDSNVTISSPKFCCICSLNAVCSNDKDNNDLIIEQQNALGNTNCRELTIQL